MWKKGKPESGNTRLLKSGLAELSRWTGAHKTSCRAYLRSLIAKLAIEEVQTFDATAGKDGARTYRIFSFDKILERRRQANMTHVIRTGAVSFIDPKTGLKLEPWSRLLPGSNLHPDGTLLSDSKQRPGSKERPVSGSNQPTRPGSNQPSPSINNFTQEKAVRTSSSDSFIRQALAQYADADDDAVNRLKFGIRRIRPDATDAEIVHFIHTKGELILKRGDAIDNPIGFLVTSVPKCFEGESFKRFRDEQGREAPTEPDNKSDYVDREYWKELAANPDATEEMRRLARQQLGAASGDEY